MGIANVVDTIKRHVEDCEDADKFFKFYRSIIARFAYDCPFSDISSRFRELVEYLTQKGIYIRGADQEFLNAPSYFFSPLTLERIDIKEPLVRKLFLAFFLENGM